MEMTLPNNLRIKAVDGGEVVDVNESERSVVSRITTDAVDSDKEIVLPKGLNLARHDKNPVVLFSHDPKSVVGKAAWKKLKGSREMIAKTIFAETDLAEETFQLVKGGFLRGWSIGMDPQSIKGREITEKDVLKRPEWAGARFVIEKADLLEFSVVSIPANEDALNRAHGEGLIKYTKQFLCAPENIVVKTTDSPSVVVRVTAPTVRLAAPIKVVAPTVRVVTLTMSEAEQYLDKRLRYARGWD